MLADTAGRWPKVDEDTADFRYVRLHGDAELYTSGYDDARSTRGPRGSGGWDDAQDVFVYFDNDAKGYAPHDADAAHRVGSGSAGPRTR